jgi:CBS domain-containing protein
VGDIMSKDVVTAAPDDRMSSVAQKMSEQSISCVVVTYKGRAIGILTEKDMLNTVAGGGTELYRLGVSERMSSPVDTIRADMSLLEADRMMEVKCIRRLPVVENGRLVGIVTQTDIARALISLNSLGCVSDIMTKHVATVHIDATAMEAARLMSCSNISCLIVTHEERIAGILTEKDLLKRIVALQKDPTQTRVVDVMSLPVVTVPSSCSIFDASKKMETMHFHRLLVTDGKAICGVVTQTDIMRAVRRSFEAVESQQHTLKMEMVDLLQRTVRDLQRVRDFLGE